MRANEIGCFKILEGELRRLKFEGTRLERRPINPAIQALGQYSQLQFTKTRARPEGLSAEEAYAGRSNLLFMVPGTGAGRTGSSIAINGHIDVVAPYFPPRASRGMNSFSRSRVAAGPISRP